MTVVVAAASFSAASAMEMGMRMGMVMTRPMLLPAAGATASSASAAIAQVAPVRPGTSRGRRGAGAPRVAVASDLAADARRPEGDGRPPAPRHGAEAAADLAAVGRPGDYEAR